MYIFGSFERLRFGDVLRGYPSIIPTIEGPFLKAISNHEIDYKIQNYMVIMDPCCAIGEIENTLSLTPLIKIDSRIWATPFLFEDVTRINEIQNPEYCAHPTTWDRYTDDEKRNCIADNPRYPYNNYFIYEPFSELVEYHTWKYKYVSKINDETGLSYYERENEKSKITTSHYMIDFKKIFHIKCKKIKKQDIPLDEEILSSKIAELEPRDREKLRNKIANYFGEAAQEDLDFLK